MKPPHLRLIRGGKANSARRVSFAIAGKSEASFVGELLRNPADIGKILKPISPSHLSDPRLRLILQVMENMHRRGAPITLHGVAEELDRMGILEEAGGAVNLAKLFDLPGEAS